METNKIYSVYVHKVDTEQGPMYYAGVTTNLKQRWIPSGYKSKSLWQYIEQYGWDSIEHIVVYETDDRKEALKTENMLICGYAAIGRCINKYRSGLIKVSDINAYDRQWKRDKYAIDSEYAECQRQYQHNRYTNDVEYAKQQRQYYRNKNATPEGKIYNRVHNFNRYHPDLIVETPLEARDKYLATGYIPQYIKHDDI